MVDLTGKHLVVVDMQSCYPGSKQPGVLDAVEQLVRHAVACQSFVIFLEFGGPSTYKRLLDQVRRYDCFTIEQKQQMDGSDQVLDACRRGAWEADAFVVCGVDTNECVDATVRELAAKVPTATVEVAVEACGSASVNEWDAFARGRNISLVSMS